MQDENGNDESRHHGERPFSIGVPFPRLDALDKVTGHEKFAADHYGDNPLWAGVKRAGVPHARLRGLDVAAARALPGVVAVLTHDDVPGTNRQGVVRKDQPVLVDDKVRHCGDGLALVLAEDKETLARALSLIEPDLEPLPGIFDMEDALADDAPLVHEDHPHGNVLLKGDLVTGKGAAAESDCRCIVEACFQTPRQEHAYLETEAGWARMEDDGKITIVCSTQTPFRDKSEVAEALGLERDRVRIVAPYAGGAFGGKDGVTVQSLLGLAALHSGGRPVKMWWSREESFIAGAKRHAARMYYRLGADADGTLRYLNVRLFLDTGAYDHLGGVVLALGLEHAGGPYRIPNAVLAGRVIYTNNPVGGAFRGFGVTQVTAAMEQTMDLLARKLGIDPLELRLKNGLTRGDKNCVGKTLVSSTGLIECLETVASHPLWKDRDGWKAAAGPFKRRGVGIVAAMHATGYGPVVPDVANAKVELTRDGKIRVYCGVVDMGQGNSSCNAQIAGSILGQAAERIELVQPDTDRTLPSGSASASRCTYTFGNALIGACEELKKRIIRRAADLLMAKPQDFEIIPGRVKNLVTGMELDLAGIAEFMDGAERIAVQRFRAPTAAERIDAGEGMDLHGLPHTLFSYAAHVARVEVDELTGCVEVTDYLAVSDCGKIINPLTYEQQIHGGIAQGLGLALMEDFSVEQGVTRTADFSTYLIPTALDVPRMVSVPVEIYEPTGPFGLKGVGEISTNCPLPAIANAVADATGERVFSAPLTGERVLLGKREDAGDDDAARPASHAAPAIHVPGPNTAEDVSMPVSLDELWDILEKRPDAALFAGGTDLFVKMRAGLVTEKALVCLERIEELKSVTDEGGTVTVGACATHGELIRNPLLKEHFPVLVESLSHIGSPPIRNMGTMGGNIVTASPAGDSLPALYLLDSELEIASAKGSRWVNIGDFIMGPGSVDLKRGEIVANVRLKKLQTLFPSIHPDNGQERSAERHGNPAPAAGPASKSPDAPRCRWIHHFEKVGLRRAQAIAVASMAAVMRLSDDGTVAAARLAWGSVGPGIVRCPDVERALAGKPLTVQTLEPLVPLVEDAVSPIDDIRATADYRRKVAGNLLLRLARYAS